MQQQSSYSNTFVMVGNPQLESDCILWNAAESKWKKIENLEVRVAHEIMLQARMLSV